MNFSMFLSDFCSMKVRAKYCIMKNTNEFLPHGYQFLRDVEDVYIYNDDNICLCMQLFPNRIILKDCCIKRLPQNLQFMQIIEKMNIIEYTADIPFIIKEGVLNIVADNQNIKFTRYDTDDVFIIRNHEICAI